MASSRRAPRTALGASVWLALLAATATAQQPDTPAAAAEPLLRCRSNDPRLLRTLADAVGAQAEPFALEDGKHGLLVLAADATVACSTVAAPGPGRPDTEVVLHPRSWLRQYTRQIEVLRRELLPHVDAALEPFGLPPGGGAGLFDDALRWLPTVAAIELTVRGSLFDASTPSTVGIRLQALPDTPFANWLRVLRPNPRGVALLPDAHTAAIALRLSLAPSALAALADPFARHLIGLNADIEGGEPRAHARFDALLAAIDGSASIDVDERGVRVALGLQHPGRYAELLQDVEWLRDERALLRGRGIEATHATEDRGGVTLLRTTVGTRSKPTLLQPDRPPPTTRMVTFAAVVGDVALTVGNADADAARTAMHRLLDEATRAPLPRAALPATDALGAAVLDCELDLGSRSPVDAAARPREADGERGRPTGAGSRLRIRASADGASLLLQLEVR